MVTTETIGVGSREDLDVLLEIVKEEEVPYLESNTDPEWDPTPYNIEVTAHPGVITRILRQLDSRNVYYETTSGLPHT